MRSLFFLFALLGLPAVADVVEEEKIELARSIFYGSDVLDLAEHSNAMTQMILTRKPHWEKHKEVISARVSKLLSSSSYQRKVAAIVAKNFSGDELLQLAEIMKSPVMAKWNKRMPEFWPQITMVTTDHVMPIVDELAKEILEIESRNTTSNQEPSEFEKLVKSGNCPAVKSLADEAIRSNNRDVEALYFKGYCLMNEQNYTKARELFLAVYEQNPNFRRVNYNLAQIYLNENDLMSAIKHATLDSKNYPSDSDSFSLLAIAHGYNGNKNESLKYFDESLRLNPKNMRSLYELALLYLRNGEKQESCKVFQSAEIHNPNIAKSAAKKDACGL
ncbi:tetratricopeptide repeat protein [Ferrimonas kyonanensis]|uniref:tetratricopeptide repeat protein n=1 Tax=Ferrimonas kyonanensis TaxID=364763 RepID=UPI00040C324D|nr:tetratricopeptide repeat protein [Ferrimonas kyonanensis]